MELEPIIAALRTRCPIFGGRVAGAAQFNLLPENAALEVPCAFVIPLDDNPGENISMNGVNQALKDSFAVVVAVNNKPDERGQSSVSNIHTIRGLLWKALLGWEPAEEYDGIAYEGGQVMRLDRARLWYQFEFGASMQIQISDSWLRPDNEQEGSLAQLPDFDGAHIRSDYIDPSDRNVVATPQPDGRIEADFGVTGLANPT